MEEKKRRRASSPKRTKEKSSEKNYSPRTSLARSKETNKSPSETCRDIEKPFFINDMKAKPISSKNTIKFLDNVSVKNEVVLPPKRSRWPFRVAGVVCAIAVAAIIYVFCHPLPYHEFPCECPTLAGPLASALSSKMFGLTGFHVQQTNQSAVNEELRALSACAKVHRLDVPFSGVDALSMRLRKDALHGNCHIWVAERVSVIVGVANALKELFEDNALRGERILPDNARGIFLLLSTEGRDQLKDILPHRVVHMLHTVAV